MTDNTKTLYNALDRIKELEEENKQLEIKIKALESANKAMVKEIDDMSNGGIDILIKSAKLKEENEQLKKNAIVWHKQDADDIYDTINDWSIHKYLCKMNDGSLNIATGSAIEGCNGDVSRSIFFVINDEKYYSDDIEAWTEITEV